MAEYFKRRPESEALRRAFIDQRLASLEIRRPFDVGDIVTTTVEGLYQYQGLMVIRKESDGTVFCSPASNIPPVAFEESTLWHFEDFHDAFRAAIEQYPYALDELGLGQGSGEGSTGKPS
jgi:hypothetical protein